jgi:4-hydroxybenzoate polyprenyltransferase
LGWRIGASVALYAGGVALNDFFDRRIDAIERPERPIPSGLVSPASAAVLGFGLLVSGIAMGAVASAKSALIASLLALMILAYDAVLKHSDLGPFVMGSCRALNLTLGLMAAPLVWRGLWWVALLPLAYIAGFTLLSRGEVAGGSRRSAAVTLAAFGAVVGALIALNLTPARMLLISPFLALLLIRVLPPLGRAYQRPQPATIRSAVHAGIVSLVIFDSTLAAGYAGAWVAAGILLLAVLAMGLGSLFAVT